MEWLELFKRLLFDAKAYLIPLGFLLLICAILRRVHIKGNELVLERNQRILFSVLGVLALTLAVLSYAQPPPPLPAIPKGTVMMWWGAKDTWPKNFELCDGHFSKELGYDKPDLQGRFVRGAKSEANQISQFERGGEDQRPLPKHEHTLPELAAGWGPRVPAQDVKLFQQIRASQTVHGGIARGFNWLWNHDDFGEGVNPAAEFRATAVFALGDAPTNRIKTAGMSEITIDTVPKFQELFYVIKVRD